MIEVSIVSGTYNRLHPYLEQMVRSVRKSVGDLSYEIILVDGGSDDGTVEWCKSQDDIVLIEQGELLGGIIAFNAGCDAATGRYVCILNDDVEVVGDTILRAYSFLEKNSYCGQVAFRNRIVGTADAKRQPLSSAYGLMYGQCCLTPRWLGNYAGWWGDEGMRTYGGDTRLSLRLWELGYPTIHVEGCEIIDHIAQDQLRAINSDDPWKMAREKGTIHPDLAKFSSVWTGRLPDRNRIIPSVSAADTVIEKVARGNLKTVRFKGMMNANDPMRKTMIDLWGELGESKQVNQNALLHQSGGRDGYQKAFLDLCQSEHPDLIILQAQHENNVTPATIHQLRKLLPFTFTVNFDGDTHPELKPFHFEIAKAVHLQCVVSPTLFPKYLANGVGVAYWPIGVENDYFVERDTEFDYDVTFMGALYGHGKFPEAENREQSVKAISEMDLKFGLFGTHWERIGLKAEYTGERHAENARIYSRSKMALSISQASNLWGYSSDRLYNICAAGCPALVQRFAGMRPHGFMDGETCIEWNTFDEMKDKIKYYLEHEDEREMIGRNGQQLVRSRHRWENRIDALLTMIDQMRRWR